MSSISSVPASGTLCHQGEEYHEAVVDRAWSRLTYAQKIELLKFLPEAARWELQKENAVYFEFFTNLPEDILSHIFSFLSTYEAFVCHAVCRRFFANNVVTIARGHLANSVVSGFFRQKFYDFAQLTPEVKEAVRVLDFQQSHLLKRFPNKLDARQFPYVDTLFVNIEDWSLHTIFQNRLQHFSALKTLSLRGQKGRCGYSNDPQAFSFLPNGIENLTFHTCTLGEMSIQQISCCFTSLKSLTITRNFDPDMDMVSTQYPYSSFSSLPITLEELHITHNTITRRDVRCLSRLTNLRSLWLSDLDTTDSLPTLPTSLTELSIHCPCDYPEHFKELTHLVNLKCFECDFNEEPLGRLQLPEWFVSLL